jgi:hypothetical protein
MSYYWLVNSTKKRLIKELKGVFTDHPYYSKIVPFIQDKFSFSERPQYGIILKSSSGNKVNLSPQNFIGTIKSYCTKAYIDGYQGMFLEWLREDTLSLKNNNGIFPTNPGFYKIEVISVNEQKTSGSIIVDSTHSIFDEHILTAITGLENTALLEKEPILGTVRLYLGNSLYGLTEGVDFEISGKNITFLTPLYPYTDVYADYKVFIGSSGPYQFNSFTSNNEILPGVVLAFGNRILQGDRCVIMVTDTRINAYDEYGGRYDMTFELDTIARDPIQAEQISDFASVSILQLMDTLANEGIVLTDGPNLGGESEEVYDEEGDEQYYSYSFSLSLQTDWAYYKPLPIMIHKILSEDVLMEMKITDEDYSDRIQSITNLDIEKFY